MKKAIIIDYNIEVQIKWECPHCHEINTTKYSPSAYSAPAEDPIDEDCPVCHEFVTLQF
jgi:rubrerythrin